MSKEEKMEQLIKMSGTIKSLRKQIAIDEEFLDSVKKSISYYHSANPEYCIRMMKSYGSFCIVTEKESQERICNLEQELASARSRLETKENYFLSQLIED